MMCADCGHPRHEHLTGPRGCTHHTNLASVFVAWCACDGVLRTRRGVGARPILARTGRRRMTEDCPTCMNGLYLVDKLRAIELMDVRVTTVPEPSSPYHEPGMICPGCGTTWFLYPTDEQIAAWTRDGVA